MTPTPNPRPDSETPARIRALRTVLGMPTINRLRFELASVLHRRPRRPRRAVKQAGRGDLKDAVQEAACEVLEGVGAAVGEVLGRLVGM